MSEYKEKTICEQVREMLAYDKDGETKFSEFVSQNMRADINKTEAYYNGQFTSGNTDADGRPKPFKNVSKPAVNIWYRAIHRNPNSLFIPGKGNKQQIASLLASIKFHEWMKEENVAQFLNKREYAMSKHGSVVIEVVEKGKKLIPSVLDWNNTFVDPIDFENNLKIKRLYLTPAQLKRNKNYNKEMVDELCENLQSRETAEGQTKDNKANYIEIFEVHGELPNSLLKKFKGEEPDDEDYENYSLQMHVVAFQAKNKDSKEFNDYTLFAGPKKNETLFLHKLIDEDGKTYPGGAVYQLFEAQWMINDTEKMIRDHLLITSKAIFQGSDDTMAGANVFSNVDNGEYLVHKPNEPMTRVETSPNIAPLQSQSQSWEQFSNKAAAIADAMTQQPNAGAAWRQIQAQLEEAHSFFERLADTSDLYLKQLFNEVILPYFKKQLIGDSKPTAKILEAHEIKHIDSRYLPAEINQRMDKKKTDVILSGNIYTPEMEQQDTQQVTQDIQGELNKMGNQRFVLPDEIDWATELKDLDWNLDLSTQSDSTDIQTKVATWQTFLNFKAQLNGRQPDADEQMALNNLASLTGTISPLQLSYNQQPAPQPSQQQINQPQPAMVGG